MLKEAQTEVKKGSYETHKRKLSRRLFMTPLAEQIGQVAEKYIEEGRFGKDTEVDIADMIVIGLAYLNWLEKDATEAFKKSLEKHERAVKRFTEQRERQQLHKIRESPVYFRLHIASTGKPSKVRRDARFKIISGMTYCVFKI
jgi:hypothetical protein